MRNKGVKSVLVSGVLLCLVIFPKISFGGVFEFMYTTHGVGDTTEDNEFEWDEQPYLYLKLPDVSDEEYPTVFSSWKFGSLLIALEFGGGNEITDLGIDEFWLTPTYWDSTFLGNPVKQVGKYDVHAFYFIINPDDPFAFRGGSGDYSFSVKPPAVIPEPATAILLSVGLLSFAYRRKLEKEKVPFPHGKGFV